MEAIRQSDRGRPLVASETAVAARELRSFVLEFGEGLRVFRDHLL